MPEYTDLIIRDNIQRRVNTNQSMLEIISNLRADHTNIAKLLQQLSAQAALLAKGEYINYQLLAEIMQYFINYPDIHHHPCEEQIFKLLRNHLPETGGTIDKITAEHNQIAKNGARILDDVKQIQGNAIFSRMDLSALLHAYIEAYKTHIETEERQLFQRAEQSLTPADWQEIVQAIKTCEDPLFGNALVGEYQSLYKSIMAQAVTENPVQ
jgi:hemerythrin-like domain-containing protein